jgi:hypothetical protein
MDERDLPQGYQYIPEKHRIDRVHKIKPEDFVNNYYLPLKPVILTGLANEWPAFQVGLVPALTYTEEMDLGVSKRNHW